MVDNGAEGARSTLVFYQAIGVEQLPRDVSDMKAEAATGRYFTLRDAQRQSFRHFYNILRCLE